MQQRKAKQWRHYLSLSTLIASLLILQTMSSTTGCTFGIDTQPIVDATAATAAAAGDAEECPSASYTVFCPMNIYYTYAATSNDDAESAESADAAGSQTIYVVGLTAAIRYSGQVAFYSGASSSTPLEIRDVSSSGEMAAAISVPSGASELKLIWTDPEKASTEELLITLQADASQEETDVGTPIPTASTLANISLSPQTATSIALEAEADSLPASYTLIIGNLTQGHSLATLTTSEGGLEAILEAESGDQIVIFGHSTAAQAYEVRRGNEPYLIVFTQ